MKIKPILFNTEMVQANLRGDKTQTRRIVRGFIPDDGVFGCSIFTPKDHISCIGTLDNEIFEKHFKLPWQQGDILYVRETWCNANKEGVKPDYYYYADTFICEDYDRTEWKWRPSIHMPKEAARIFLKVTDVRVERLQDMTLDDFLNEGISLPYEVFNDPENAYMQAKKLFTHIWNSTIKEPDLECYGWNANPWVWVIEFERCEKPKEPFEDIGGV